MDYLVEGLSTDDIAHVFGGASSGIDTSMNPHCGIKSCTDFVCGTFTDPCRAMCIGVGCHPIDCGDFGC